MKRARNKAFLTCVGGACLVIAIVAGDAAWAAAAPPPPRRDLLVHAAGRYSDKISPVWVAMVEKPAKEGQPEKTVVLSREEIGDKKWQQLPDTPARVVGLTNHGTELVVLLETKDGSAAGGRRTTWAWFSTDRQLNSMRFSYGPSLPESMRLITLAGDRKALYALGMAPADAGTASRPTSGAAAEKNAAAAATRPQPVQPMQPVLFVLSGDKWTPMIADWPKEAAGSAADLASMHVIDNAPHVAVPAGPKALRIYRFERNPAGWQSTDEVPIDGEVRFVKLLNSEERPALWVQTAGEALGYLWSRKHKLAQQVQFAGPKPNAEEVDVTVSSDVRLFFKRDDKPHEQHFGWDGAPSGQAAALDWTRPRADPSMNLLTTVFMTVLAVLLVSTLLRRRSMNRDDERGEPEE
jgi:hypothetical protein